jgi:hypothetical protein
MAIQEVMNTMLHFMCFYKNDNATMKGTLHLLLQRFNSLICSYDCAFENLVKSYQKEVHIMLPLRFAVPNVCMKSISVQTQLDQMKYILELSEQLNNYITSDNLILQRLMSWCKYDVHCKHLFNYVISEVLVHHMIHALPADMRVKGILQLSGMSEMVVNIFFGNCHTYCRSFFKSIRTNIDKYRVADAKKVTFVYKNDT